MLTFLLIAGYVPVTLALLAGGLVWGSRRNESVSARTLGDRVGRRSGDDRRVADGMAFVGADRRSGVDRRGVVAATQDDQAERAA